MSMSVRDSTRTELEAVWKALIDLGPGMEGHTVLHRTDSM